MKIPLNLSIHQCNSCKKKLAQENFLRCGVTLPKPSVIFEYECGHCGHFGRYILDVADALNPSQALRKLADLLEKPSKKEEETTKGNIRSQLNKIKGVQDLLKLGGENAPRESSNR